MGTAELAGKPDGMLKERGGGEARGHSVMFLAFPLFLQCFSLPPQGGMGRDQLSGKPDEMFGEGVGV